MKESEINVAPVPNRFVISRQHGMEYADRMFYGIPQQHGKLEGHRERVRKFSN